MSYERPIAESRQLLAESLARWQRLNDVWEDLTIAEQEQLLMQAEAMATDDGGES